MLSAASSCGLNHVGQLPIGACSSSLWKNNGNQLFQHQQQLPRAQNLFLSEFPTSSGFQELYQSLRSSSTTRNNIFCNSEHLQSVSSNGGTCPSSAAATTMATTTTASIMEPIPLTGGEFGYWNQAISWPDISMANGAFH